jgi:flagellar biosynthetic protein FliR
MTLDIPIAFSAVKFFAVFARVASFLFAMPFFSAESFNIQIRIFIVLIVTVALMPVVPGAWMTNEFFDSLDMTKMAVFMTSEALLGLTLALFVLFIVETLRFAGDIIDREIGFTMAQVIDPSSDVQAGVFSNMMGQFIILMFFIFDCHHEVIRIASESFRTLPPGSFILSESIVEASVYMGNQMLLVGTQIALPVLGAMLLLNVAFGFLTRIGGDFPVMELSLATHFLVGFVILKYSFPVITSLCRRLNQEMIEWMAWLVNISV